jgi:D-tyrosyl-tRNA(Tyr) deacylase
MGDPAITLSLSDPAGQTMLEIFKDKGFKQTNDQLILQKSNVKLIIIQPLIVPEDRYMTSIGPEPYPIDYDRIAVEHSLEYIVVASRHWAKSGKPSLTVHPTGNFGNAMYGGRDKELQWTSPQTMRNIYRQLIIDPPSGFSVSLEATHHSPTQFKTPLFFVEVGSRETQWRDAEVCEFLVNAILKGIKSIDKAPVAIGFGGGHYCPKFSKKIIDYAIGHMAARYSIDLLTEDLINQMVQKSPKTELILTDGLKGRQKKKVKGFLSKYDFPTE